MKPTPARYFRSAAELRRWLQRHRADAPVLLVGFHKIATGRAGLTYSEALDEALCFGWVDGVRRTVDGERYTIVFTPRRPRSFWSRINVARAEALIAAGRMRAPGRAAFERRDPARTARLFRERDRAALTPEERRQFAGHRRAWEFFESQTPSYRRIAIWFVASAKRAETRLRRLERLIRCSAKGERLG